jgi:hypothetical protein
MNFNLIMFSTSKVILFSFVFVILLISCRTTKLKQSSSPAPDRTAEEVLGLLKKNERGYDFYTAKINSEIDTEDFGISVQIGLWVKKNKYIFSTYKKLNFEAARSYITPDSIYIINRLQGYYNAEEIRSIWNIINMQVPVSQMQDIIVGNHIVPVISEVINFSRQDEDYLLHFAYEGNDVKYTINGYTGMVRQVKISSPAHGDITADYEDFRSTGGVKRPYKNTILLKSPELNATIKLNLKEIIWDKDSDIQFSIPARYERYGL